MEVTDILDKICLENKVFVRAKCDYIGEPSTTRLSFCSGDILMANRNDTKSEWLEGMDSDGNIGLFQYNMTEELDFDDDLIREEAEIVNKVAGWIIDEYLGDQYKYSDFQIGSKKQEGQEKIESQNIMPLDIAKAVDLDEQKTENVYQLPADNASCIKEKLDRLFGDNLKQSTEKFEHLKKTENLLDISSTETADLSDEAEPMHDDAANIKIIEKDAEEYWLQKGINFSTTIAQFNAFVEELDEKTLSPNEGQLVDKLECTSKILMESAKIRHTADETIDLREQSDEIWEQADTNSCYAIIGPRYVNITPADTAAYIAINSNAKQTCEDNEVTVRQRDKNAKLLNDAFKTISHFDNVENLISPISTGQILKIKQQPVKTQLIKVLQVRNEFVWMHNHRKYTVEVSSPKKGSKFHGIKSFTTYQLTPSFNETAVYRRYKHFDWLSYRLREKYNLLMIPALPDKQLSGLFHEQLIQHRCQQFQEFVNWMCRHPILSQCEVWLNFLTCVDETSWKFSKRKAEEDKYDAEPFCLTIQLPEYQLSSAFSNHQISKASDFGLYFANSINKFYDVCANVANHRQLQGKLEFQRIGDAFCDLACAMNLENLKFVPKNNQPLLSEIAAHFGAIHINTGRYLLECAKPRWSTLLSRIYFHRGVANQLPVAIINYKLSLQRRRENNAMVSQVKKKNYAEHDELSDAISYAMLAEMSHFKAERESQLKETIKSMIAEELVFYKCLLAKLIELQNMANFE